MQLPICVPRGSHARCARFPWQPVASVYRVQGGAVIVAHSVADRQLGGFEQQANPLACAGRTAWPAKQRPAEGKRWIIELAARGLHIDGGAWRNCRTTVVVPEKKARWHADIDAAAPGRKTLPAQLHAPQVCSSRSSLLPASSGLHYCPAARSLESSLAVLLLIPALACCRWPLLQQKLQ